MGWPKENRDSFLGHRVVPVIAKGDVIGITLDRGEPRWMRVSHIEHHIITLTDLDEPAGGDPDREDDTDARSS